MAAILRRSFVLYNKQLKSNTSHKYISTTRKLLSQEWQQEGIPGANLPFSFKNKYLFTLMCVVFFTSGLNAPFLIMVRKFKLDNSQDEAAAVKEQSLTKVYCTPGAES